MASFNQVSAGGNVNVSAIVSGNVRNISRNGTSVTFEYQAYIYQNTNYWSANSWCLWVEGSKNTVFNSNGGSTHTSQNTKYYTGWYKKTITLGANVSTTTVSIGVNGLYHYPSNPNGYVTLTLSGLPTISAPSLSNISVSSIVDKSAYFSFTVTANNGQSPYDPHIDISTNSSMTSIVKTISARNGTISGLNPNRTYYARGNDANVAGRTYTNVISFTTPFYVPSSPGKPNLTYTGTEPILSSIINASWPAASGGSTPIAGYRIALLKNGQNIFQTDTENNSTTYNFGTFSSKGFQVGDMAQIYVYSYSKDWAGNKHFSQAAVYSNKITVVSDKFIYSSKNGGAFNKYKLYISVNGGTFKEVKKEKFRVIR